MKGISAPQNLVHPTDQISNRQTAELVKTVNEIIKLLKDFPPRYKSTERPAADSKSAGQLIILQADNIPDKLQCCLRTGDGTYTWVTVAQH
jgi:hypothetical protein